MIRLAICLFAVGLGASLPGYAHDVLSLGDGRVSNGPRIGSVFSCQQQFNANAPGARRAGRWIRGSTWRPGDKIKVAGSENWPDWYIRITVKGGTRIISANNLPKHPTGTFPVAAGDPAARYDRNPNRIRAHRVELKLPVLPVAADRAQCLPMGVIGFTTSGAALFNALDARGQDAPAHEVQDIGPERACVPEDAPRPPRPGG